MKREKELRYILAALTGNKALLNDQPREHIGPGPKPEELSAPLDKAAMELSRRFAALGV